MTVHIISRSKVIVRERQRRKRTSQKLNELRESIRKVGLLHPPMVYEVGDGTYLLVVGGGRTEVIDMLAKEGTTFYCAGMPITPGEFPCTFTHLEETIPLKEAELEENIIREDLDWRDRAEALAEIHKMRKEANPTQTVVQTGKELAQRGGAGKAKTAESLRNLVQESVLISEHLDDPTIAKARNAKEARQLILQKEEHRVNSIIARRRLASMPQKPDIEIRHGDLESILPSLDASQFDLVIGDPPYGINAGAGGFRSRTVHHHNYIDDPETARRIAQCILTEGFRITNPRANLFLFTDIALWDWLQRVSAQIGWTPFRRPLIWGKSDSEGLAPWGSQGPRITTELIFFATKGQKGLLSSPIDYQRVNRVPRRERIYAAEKPVELIRKLIECSTTAGDRIIDPCCGSGSSLVAARELKRRGLGIEIDESAYHMAMSNVHMREDGDVGEAAGTTN